MSLAVTAPPFDVSGTVADRRTSAALGVARFERSAGVATGVIAPADGRRTVQAPWSTRSDRSLGG